MIAANFTKFPDALLAQRELELAPPVDDAVSEADLICRRASFAAAGAWIRQYATAAARKAKSIPAWFAEMRKRAIALAKAIRDACQSLL